MNADERHELQRNELEDYTAKVKPFLARYGRTIGLVALALVLLLISLSFWASRSRANLEAGWGEFFEAGDAQGFQDLAELDAGTGAAVWARVAAGQRYLDNATRAIFTDRAAADDDLDSARENFEAALAIGDAPDAARAQAIYGLAAVEEVTGGGNLDAAKDRLEELIADYPASPLVPVAEMRLKELDDPAVAPFYAWFATQNPTPRDLARPLDGSVEDGPALPSRPAGLERIGSSADAGAPAATVEVDSAVPPAPADDAAAETPDDADAEAGIETDAEPVAEADGE